MKPSSVPKPERPSSKASSQPEPPIVCGGGPGVGALCTVCDVPVGNSEMEFEIEFEQEGGGGLDNFLVHRRCFAAWEFERRNGRAA
jgi:hypothetical protein